MLYDPLQIRLRRVLFRFHSPPSFRRVCAPLYWFLISPTVKLSLFQLSLGGGGLREKKSVDIINLTFSRHLSEQHNLAAHPLTPVLIGSNSWSTHNNIRSLLGALNLIRKMSRKKRAEFNRNVELRKSFPFFVSCFVFIWSNLYGWQIRVWARPKLGV